MRAECFMGLALQGQLCAWGCLSKAGFRTEIYSSRLAWGVLILWGPSLVYLFIQMFVLPAVCIELGIGISSDEMVGICLGMR